MVRAGPSDGVEAVQRPLPPAPGRPAGGRHADARHQCERERDREGDQQHAGGHLEDAQRVAGGVARRPAVVVAAAR